LKQKKKVLFILAELTLETLIGFLALKEPTAGSICMLLVKPEPEKPPCSTI